jgi:Zn finger protein HypA/HybF involved in hydrogenase expression
MKCPCCGVSSRDDPEAAEVTRVLEAKPLGTYSIAGVQTKVVARQRLQLRCTRCGWRTLGHVDSADGKFATTPADMRWPADRAVFACPQCGTGDVHADEREVRCRRCPFTCPRDTP